ncbi:MAG: hypothetical protein L3J93_01475 [Thermoplasmata archaeon]|nr:hypothetical protein [Thermoplasmata archaeon]
MGSRSIALDLSILRQGFSIGREFGFASLEEFARLGSFLEHAFYEPGSLAADPPGFSFRLANPPLRLGAFSAIRLRWDGALVPPERAAISVGASHPPRSFAEIDADHPLLLSFGGPIRISVQAEPQRPGLHRLRLELQSLAIPPLVWIEITDHLRAE